MIESIEKLREWSRLFDDMYVMEEGDICHIYNRPLTDSMKSWGELMREQCGEIEREIAERYMLLPCDADGVPIRIGDTVREINDCVPMKVMSLTFYEDCVDVNACGMNPKRLFHVNPRTIEDVLRDVWKEALDYAKSDMWRNPDEVFAERADEIRELMEVDA